MSDIRDAACPWCDFTAVACLASTSAGYIKCCPDCDHRRTTPTFDALAIETFAAQLAHLPETEETP